MKILSIKNIKSEFYMYFFTAFCVAVSTIIFILGRDYFAKGQWALLYLLIIVFIASFSGVRPALLAAILAFLAWNYFLLPPYHTFQIGDTKDWLSLVVFLIVGIAMGLQTGRMREREHEALAREHEMALLNEFSAYLVSDSEVSDTAEALLNKISQTTRAKCVALFLPDEQEKLYDFCSSSGQCCATDSSIIAIAEWAYWQVKAVGLPVIINKAKLTAGEWPISVNYKEINADENRRDLFIPLQTSSRREGVLYVGQRDDGSNYKPRDAILLVAIANQFAAFLERKRLQTMAIQADALRESDKLKSTFYTSVSHELKTPLASITATITNLLESDIQLSEISVKEELQAVQGDLQRLNDSISSLIDLSRLETSAWKPKTDWYEFGDILGTTLSRIPSKQQNRISFSVPQDLPLVYVDFNQLVRALQNLLENALTYSPKDSPVRIGSSFNDREVKVWVEDEGKGIPLDERQKVFEKFYRGASSKPVLSGTGLGLAVTYEIVRFHGGKIWIEDVEPHGTRFVITLPRQEQLKV